MRFGQRRWTTVRCPAVCLRFVLATAFLTWACFGVSFAQADGAVTSPAWKSWGGLQPAFGSVCPRPHAPPESRIEFVSPSNNRLTLQYTCSVRHHIFGPERLVCDRTSGEWTRPASWGAQHPVCAVCPAGWVGYQGNCYLFVSFRRKLRNWTQARNFCLAANARLVEIPNAGVQALIVRTTDEGSDFVDENFRSLKHASAREVWVGLSNRSETDRLTWDFSNRTLADTGYIEPDFQLSRPGSTENRCLVLDEGKWRLEPCDFYLRSFICQKRGYVTCGVPRISNGHWGPGDHSQDIVLICHEGYELVGPIRYVCDTSVAIWRAGNIEYSANSSRCDPLRCPMPPDGLGASSPEVREYRPGEKVEYSCRSGYVLESGRREITCQPNESWSTEDVLQCKRCERCHLNNTVDQVCDNITGACLCDDQHGVIMPYCRECKELHYRARNDSGACKPCLCEPKTSVLSECHEETGQCQCTCGFEGRNCSTYNVTAATCPAQAGYPVPGRGKVDWPQALLGERFKVACQFGGFVTRRCGCGVQYRTKWLDLNTSTCAINPDPNGALAELLDLTMTVENVGEVAGAMKDITADEKKIERTTLELSGDVVAKVVNVSVDSRRVGEGLVNAFSNIVNVNADVLAAANTKSNTSNRMLLLVDQYAITAGLASSGGRRVYPSDNMKMEIRDVGGHQLQRTVLGGEEEVTNDDARVRRDVAMEPSLSLAGIRVKSVGTFRVQFTVFRNATLFEREANRSAAASAENREFVSNQTGSRLGLNTDVVSAGLHRGSKSVAFKGEISVDMAIKQEALNPVCVFWDYSLNYGQGGWNRQGCRVVYEGNETTRLPANSRVQCKCTHMTHFAVLMDLDPGRQPSAQNLMALSYITYIGCSLSMAALLVAIVIILAFKKLRQQKQMSLLLHLCISWLLALVFFITGMQVTDHRASCMAMAVLTHFFLLAVFAFSFAQAYYLYSSLVRVYGKLIRKFMWKCIALGWGIPTLIVVITMAATTMDAYEPAKTGKVVCLISFAQSKVAFIVTFYVPVALVLVANCVVLVLVLRRVVKPRPGMQKRDIQDVKRDVKLSVSLALLLGLTWVFGMALAGDVKIVFEYIFTILNAFLGLCLVVLQVGFRKEARDEISRSWSRFTESSEVMSKLGLRTTTSSGAVTLRSNRHFGTLTRDSKVPKSTMEERSAFDVSPAASEYKSQASPHCSVAPSDEALAVVDRKPAASVEKNGFLAVRSTEPKQLPLQRHAPDDFSGEEGTNSGGIVLLTPPAHSAGLGSTGNGTCGGLTPKGRPTSIQVHISMPEEGEGTSAEEPTPAMERDNGSVLNGAPREVTPHAGAGDSKETDAQSTGLVNGHTPSDRLEANWPEHADELATGTGSPEENGATSPSSGDGEEENTVQPLNDSFGQPTVYPPKLSRNISELSTTPGRVIMFPDDSMISNESSA